MNGKIFVIVNFSEYGMRIFFVTFARDERQRFGFNFIEIKIFKNHLPIVANCLKCLQSSDCVSTKSIR